MLEHVPSDWASARELYRVLRPGGKLVITYLPNWLSLHEYQLRRNADAHGRHDRLYRRREVAQMLLPLASGRSRRPSTRRSRGSGRPSGCSAGPVTDRVAGLLRGVAPVHVVGASTFCVVAEKVEFID